MARWRGGAVARWRGGEVTRWRGGAVAKWRSEYINGNREYQGLDPVLLCRTLVRFIHSTFFWFS